MHPAFTTIEFGPFQTAYHREAVDGRFREALSEFLERELLPQLDEPCTRTQGRLTAEFDAENYCGPNSAVRDAYKLELSFIREHGTDEIKAQVYRDPKTGNFRTRFKGQSLILWTEKLKAEQQSFREAIEHMVKRIHAGDHSQWVCPRCSTHLSLIDSSSLFDLSCPQGCFNYNFHRDPKTKEFMHGHFFSRPLKPSGGNAEPTASPNGGPATQFGNSGATEGPPSVS